VKIDCHCHTIYSKHWFWGYDSINTPKEMIKAAIKKGLDGIAITDHNTIKGGLVGKKIAKGFKNFIVIIGSEIRTRTCELIGLDIKEDVPMNLSLEETIEKIHDLGGIAVIPHPFGKYFLKRYAIKNPLNSDAIEVFNSTVRKNANKRALELANKFKKAKTAGSDAHSIKSVGDAGIICYSNPIEDILKRRVKIFGKRTSLIDMSNLIAKKFTRSIEWRILGRKGKYV
jgi:predicted metal-dependent phosphoesterase TrpH